jgi:hypothetical protein
MGVFQWAIGVFLVSEKERSQEEQWSSVRGVPHLMVYVRCASAFFPSPEGHRMWVNVMVSP